MDEGNVVNFFKIRIHLNQIFQFQKNQPKVNEKIKMLNTLQFKSSYVFKHFSIYLFLSSIFIENSFQNL